MASPRQKLMGGDVFASFMPSHTSVGNVQWLSLRLHALHPAHQTLPSSPPGRLHSPPVPPSFQPPSFLTPSWQQSIQSTCTHAAPFLTILNGCPWNFEIKTKSGIKSLPLQCSPLQAISLGPISTISPLPTTVLGKKGFWKINCGVKEYTKKWLAFPQVARK